jgi:hypothetical protein
LEWAAERIHFTDTIQRFMTMADDARMGTSGERVLREAFSLYEILTSHFPKLDFKDFCNLTRSEIKLNKSFNSVKFQVKQLGIEGVYCTDTTERGKGSSWPTMRVD